MITTRTPLRITLGGGGSDLAPGGACLAATIDKYVTITVAPTWEPVYVLHYSHTERWEHADQIEHRIFRAAFTALDIPPGIQVSSIADVPAGTGLGNSGAFTVGLLHALRPEWSRPHLAHMACLLDIGQQDQWSATYGGTNIYDFKTGAIRPVHMIPVPFALYYTGLKHDAAEICTGPAKAADEAHHEIAVMVAALESGDPRKVGDCLTAQWAAKLVRAPTRAHKVIDVWLRQGLLHGATGGKLVGAGDGGFLLFSVEDEDRLDQAMTDLGLRKLPFRLTHEGTRCM